MDNFNFLEFMHELPLPTINFPISPRTHPMNLNYERTSHCINWNFDNSFTHLPQAFYTAINPIPVPAPRTVLLNHTLAESLGLNRHKLTETEAALFFSGNRLPQGAQSVAQAYAGHQFGHFTMLGDGRAVLLGEHITPAGDRFDIQLKGSGQTRFSRRGDGRAALAPMLREYIISEAMHALGIPTTRSLAVVTTGESVMRETVLPGAVLTRVASSHIRVGTFEYAARLDETDQIKILADYTIRRHYPELAAADNCYLAFLHSTIERQASLVAQWMLVGFIHGVMNTDNMAISGETIDYGPCAFMDTYDPDTVFSSIDHYGRYCYRNQPHAAQWNLARFAETLLLLLHAEQQEAIALAENAVHAFTGIFQNHWLGGMRKKLGLFNEEASDRQLIEDLLNWMYTHHSDYTNCFRSLSLEMLPDENSLLDPEFAVWHARWQERLARQPESKELSLRLMQANNPAIIPRNHRVEEALQAASEQNDYQLLHRLLAALSNPYTNTPESDYYASPPMPEERIYRTFCGT